MQAKYVSWLFGYELDPEYPSPAGVMRQNASKDWAKNTSGSYHQADHTTNDASLILGAHFRKAYHGDGVQTCEGMILCG
jgi:hypothetical protein